MRRASVVVVVLACGVFGWMLLFSPYYQGWKSLKLAAAEGHFVPLVRSEPVAPFGGDFLTEWLAGYIIRAGDRQRLYDRDYAHQLEHDPAVMGVELPADQSLFLFYPPAYYLLVMPLSLLPIQLAAILWFVLMAACLVAFAALMAQAFPETPRLFAAVLLASVLFAPALRSLDTGQKGTLWLALLSAVFLLLRREHPLAAGLVFGLLALKPPLTLAVGLTMLFKRQWRFMAGSLITLSLLVAASLFLGLDVCLGYLRSITGTVEFTLIPQYPLEDEHSGYGFFALLLRKLAAPKLVIQGLAALLGLVVLIVTLLVCRGPFDFRGERFLLQFAGLVIATALMSLKLQKYDLAILLLPVALLACVGLQPSPAFAAASALLNLAALLLYAICLVSEPVALATGIQLTVPVMLVLLLWLLRLLEQRPVAVASPAEPLPHTV
jgi:hypothetical protein